MELKMTSGATLPQVPGGALVNMPCGGQNGPRPQLTRRTLESLLMAGGKINSPGLWALHPALAH